MRKRRSYVPLVRAIVTFVIVSLFAGAAGGQTNPTIRIAQNPIDLGAEVLYANDLGFFKRAGLDVEVSVLASGSVVASAVSGGAVDIGQANSVALAAAHANGLPFIIGKVHRGAAKRRLQHAHLGPCRSRHSFGTISELRARKPMSRPCTHADLLWPDR